MGIYRPESSYDNRQIVHATPRYRGTSTCFTSIDDDQTDPSKIWGGSNKIKLDHVIAQPASQTIYLDFNTIDNKTYILTGFLHWHDAIFDELTVSIVPQVTTYSTSTNTDYDLYNGYMIIPNGTSTGTIAVNDADRKLVQVSLNEFGQKASAGYWDADYNTTTKQFENITANASGDGDFNMFSTEVIFHSYLNKFIMHGTDRESLTAFDADQLGHGTRLKFVLDTIGTDHNWQFNGAIVMFREKSS